jgi:hypothetical protein
VSGATGGTFANSIDAKGAVAGYYVIFGGAYHGFERAADGTIKTFDPPNSTYTRPESIAGHAAVSGYFSDTSGVYHGFLRGK